MPREKSGKALSIMWMYCGVPRMRVCSECYDKCFKEE